MLKCVLGGVMLSLCAGSAMAQWSDDFDRPDGPIGGNWTSVIGTGTWVVTGNQGAHTSSGVNDTIQYTGASLPYTDSVSTLDVFCPGTASQFSAVMIGLGGSDSIMVKIQDQVAATAGFSNIGIYHRTSATGWGAWTGTGTGFAALTAPFLSGRLTVYFSDADTLVAEVDTDFNGTADQTYTKTGVTSIAANLGTGYGIGAWQTTALFDNWSVAPVGGGCYPDCDGDGALTLADFGCFQTKFALGDLYADCNGDQILNLADFGCYQTAFALGCP